MVSREPVLLMVAAEAFEFDGLVRRMERVEKQPASVQFLRRGRLNGRETWLAADGPGPRRATAALEAARQWIRPKAIVSTGLAGALDPALAPGEIFVATEVDAVEQERRYPVLKPETQRRYAKGLLYSADRVAGNAAEKSALWRGGASAVEMEAAAAARCAAAWDVPLYCIRVISDTATESFSMDLNRMRDAEGRFRKGEIVAAACARPWSGIPELYRLWHRGRVAAERLGAFLADCQY